MRILRQGILHNLTAFFFLLNINTYAVHVWGGELEASCDGNNNYTFKLSLYVDCGRVATMPNSETIKVYDKSGALVKSIALTNFKKDTLPTTPNPCAKTVAGTCIGRVVAQGTSNLPMNADGYVVSYSSCCRNSNIGNITNPGNTGQIYSIELPGTNDVTTCNSSPIFNALPPSEICTNLPVEIDFSATDSDGDKLKYKFFHPYGDVNGEYSGAPPFPNITFTPPYSFNNPMNSGLSINENTGLITGTPTTSGLFALGVVVEEYRKGKLVGRKVRDFTYTVVPCVPELSVGNPTVLTCADEPVYFSFEFDGILKKGTTPQWDFGDPASGLNNTSNLFEPIHEYSALGTYYATVSIEDSCGNELNESIQVDIIETVANVEAPDQVCKGEDVTLTCTDTPCELTEWYVNKTSTTPIHTGCTYEFTLSEDKECIYFEPFVDPNDYTVGANAEQGWGTDVANATTFNAITPLTIEGFTLRGDQYWNGCANFNAMITVEQGGLMIAGPEFVTIDCDGESVITGLQLNVPQGSNYQLKVSGATVRPAIGGPINQVGLINVSPGGPFYNILVHSNQKCARRDSICVESNCPCPDTSLTFPPNFCANQDFNLGTLKTNTTSAGSWTIKNSPPGTDPATIKNDSIFDGNGANAGVYTILYTIEGNHPGCIVENEREIEIYKVDSARIPDHGPYCEKDIQQQINLSQSSSTGGTWSSPTANVINSNTGIFDPSSATAGKHWIFYESPSVNCPAIDSIEIEVKSKTIAKLATQDTSVCANSSSFVIRKSSNANNSGIWFGENITDSLFNPSKPGTFNIKYVVNGLNSACSDTGSVLITVISPDTANITPDQGPFCKLGGDQTLSLESNSTIGGTWSSNTTGAISTNGVFNPLNADIGIHKVFYSTPGPLCPSIDSIEIKVTNASSADIATGDTSVCLNSDDFIITKSAETSLGGIWIGPQQTDSLFSPKEVGLFKVKYVVIGQTEACSDSDNITINVIAPDTANITPNQGPFCKLGGKHFLKLDNNTTPWGTWSSSTIGAITSNGEFDPLNAGIGKHKVYYNTPGVFCPTSDSIEIEVIDALKAEIITNDTSICLGSNPFVIRKSNTTSSGGNWKGNQITDSLFNPTQAGTFKIKYILTGLTSACSDSDSVMINVISPDTVEIPNHGPYCIMGAIDTIKYTQNTTPNGTWSSPTATINGMTGEFNPLTSGEGKHWLFYSSPNKLCWIKDSIEIEIIEKLSAKISNTDTVVCANSSNISLRLYPSASNQGSWSGTAVSASTFSPTVSGEGTFKIYYQTSGLDESCSDIDSVEIEVLTNRMATINHPNPNQFCIGDTAITIRNLDTSNSGSWWSSPSGLITQNGNFNPSNASPGTITIFYGIEGLCGDTSSTSLKVHSVKDPTINKVNPVCEISDDQKLSAVDAGEWKINNIVCDGTFSPSNLGPGLHRIINSINDYCPVSDTIYIEVKENPSPLIGADTTEGCSPLIVNFKDLTDSNAITTTWEITDGKNIIYETSQIDSLEYIFGNQGCYDISISSTFEYGCANTAKLPYQICAHTPPNADFEFTNTPVNIKDPKVYTINNSINANTFNWKFGKGRPIIETEYEAIVEHKTDRQDTLDVELIASNGWCNDTIKKSIIIWDFFTLSVPNAFTPNGDGLNETFYPMGKNHDYENFVFIIFNRWGDKIFESTIPYQGWDGTWQGSGKECQEDVYVWKIITRDIYENEHIQRVGTVALIR